MKKVLIPALCGVVSVTVSGCGVISSIWGTNMSFGDATIARSSAIFSHEDNKQGAKLSEGNRNTISDINVTESDPQRLSLVMKSNTKQDNQRRVQGEVSLDVSSSAVSDITSAKMFAKVFYGEKRSLIKPLIKIQSLKVQGLDPVEEIMMSVFMGEVKNRRLEREPENSTLLMSDPLIQFNLLLSNVMGVATNLSGSQILESMGESEWDGKEAYAVSVKKAALLDITKQLIQGISMMSETNLSTMQSGAVAGYLTIEDDMKLHLIENKIAPGLEITVASGSITAHRAKKEGEISGDIAIQYKGDSIYEISADIDSDASKITISMEVFYGNKANEIMTTYTGSVGVDGDVRKDTLGKGSLTFNMKGSIVNKPIGAVLFKVPTKTTPITEIIQGILAQ